MDKRQRANLFRDRLSTAMEQAGFNRSSLAREARVDRSTISQLLSDQHVRLPNAQLVADCATTLGVSADWLLGLTDRPERPGDLLAASVQQTDATRTSADNQLLNWHEEAAGQKIRHVPATLPDILKTKEMIRWEYGDQLTRTPDQAVRATMDRLEILRSGRSDYEIAIRSDELAAMARGQAYYQGLPKSVRLAQLESLAEQCETLYPTLRLFLFDPKRLFSAPVTVFGSFLAVIYLGQSYLAFRSEDRVRSLARHFDLLVRECDVDARDVAGYLRQLIDTVQQD